MTYDEKNGSWCCSELSYVVTVHSFRLYLDRFYQSVFLQPEDWDDREYIDDPNDVKPEVTCLVNMVAI